MYLYTYPRRMRRLNKTLSYVPKFVEKYINNFMLFLLLLQARDNSPTHIVVSLFSLSFDIHHYYVGALHIFFSLY